MAPCPATPRLGGPRVTTKRLWMGPGPKNVGPPNPPDMETVPKSEAEQAENFLDQNAEQFQPSSSVKPARDRGEFRSRLAVRAREQGFVRIGVAPADPFLEAGQRFRDWLHQGFAGNMEYLAEFGCREDPGRLLANARSVVVAAAALPRRSASSATATSAPTGIVADYALGLDY